MRLEVKIGLEALDPNPFHSEGKSLAVRMERIATATATVNSEVLDHERVGDEVNLVDGVAMVTWKEGSSLKGFDPNELEMA